MEAPAFRALITTSSLGPGKPPGPVPPVQLPAVSQSPPAGLFQITVAGAIRFSSNSRKRRLNFDFDFRWSAVLLVQVRFKELRTLRRYVPTAMTAFLAVRRD